ncbi:hypothetical protein KW445_06700 [Vibrio fluvialis]|nr:hypothetical protein [Vibrio fluvialis]
MYPLVKDKRLGTLDIHNVYEEYDGPKLFSAVNALGLYYLVYWIDELENGDVWLYVPMSKDRLDSIESGSRLLRDAFLYPEENSIFKIFTAFDGCSHTIALLSAEEISDDELPPVGFKVENEYAVREFEETQLTVNHEIHVARASRRGALHLNSISKVLDAWSSLYNEFARRFDVDDKLVPVDARPGSFTLRLESRHYDVLATSIDDFFVVIEHSDDVHLTLLNMGIDVDVVKEFLSLIVDSAYDFKLTPLGDFGNQHFLSKAKAESILNDLRTSELTYLSSLKVPQADDIFRVFDVVDAKANFEDVNEYTLQITPRQVAYYLHAARSLGYLNAANQPTSAAMQFNQLSREQKLQSAAMRFQSSDCGWAWINWSKGKTLLDIPDGSGFEFLLHCVPSLNENTAGRRSKTLNSWLRIFKNVLSS